MIQINIVDTLLGYLGEYVNVDIRDEDTDRLLCNYDGRNSIDEEYLGSEIKNFVVDNGLVTIWVECKKWVEYTELSVEAKLHCINIYMNAIAPYTNWEDVKDISDIEIDLREMLMCSEYTIDMDGNWYDECGKLI